MKEKDKGLCNLKKCKRNKKKEKTTRDLKLPHASDPRLKTTAHAT